MLTMIAEFLSNLLCCDLKLAEISPLRLDRTKFLPQLVLSHSTMANRSDLPKTANSIPPVYCVCTREAYVGIIVGRRYVSENSPSLSFARKVAPSGLWTRVYSAARIGKRNATSKRRQQTVRRGFTWNWMGDRGYREHSAGISCCHDATKKRGAQKMRANNVAGVQRVPHSAPTSKLGVYTWQSRHFGVSSRHQGFIFAHGFTGAPRHDESPCE